MGALKRRRTDMWIEGVDPRLSDKPETPGARAARKSFETFQAMKQGRPDMLLQFRNYLKTVETGSAKSKAKLVAVQKVLEGDGAATDYVRAQLEGKRVARPAHGFCVGWKNLRNRIFIHKLLNGFHGNNPVLDLESAPAVRFAEKPEMVEFIAFLMKEKQTEQSAPDVLHKLRGILTLLKSGKGSVHKFVADQLAESHSASTQSAFVQRMNGEFPDSAFLIVLLT